jgi:hypothetical protein
MSVVASEAKQSPLMIKLEIASSSWARQTHLAQGFLAMTGDNNARNNHSYQR